MLPSSNIGQLLNGQQERESNMIRGRLVFVGSLLPSFGASNKPDLFALISLFLKLVSQQAGSGLIWSVLHEPSEEPSWSYIVS